jgi:hypothetical protein
MRADSDDPTVFEDDVDILREHDLMHLFDELTFRQKWSRVHAGLQQPRSSGEHKWARLQLLRLLSPLLAVCVPLLLLLLIAVLAQFTPPPSDAGINIVLREPPPDEKLDVVETPVLDRVETSDPVVEVFTDHALLTDSDSPQAEVAAVQIIQQTFVQETRSPVSIAGFGTPRGPGERDKAVRTHVAEHTVPSVLRALRWLAVQQHEDGSWGNTKPALTSLALLAYLAHGDTPDSEEFGVVVERGLRFLVDAQQPDGRFSGRDNHDYTHPITAYALAEAFGMHPSPQLRAAAVKAIERVVQGQNAVGSWDYNLNPQSPRSDISYAGWCVQALKAASIAGLDREVPGIPTAMERAVGGIRANFGAAGEVGGFGYTSPSATHGLSGVGVLALQFLGAAHTREARLGLAGLERWPFDWENPRGRSPLYWWYYNTQAYFQEGGELWKQWNQVFSHTLVQVQSVITPEESGYVDHEGLPHETGYWDSPSATELTAGNGRVMDTILCTLMLEVYYRHLPTFRQISKEDIQQELGDNEDLVIRFVQR